MCVDLFIDNRVVTSLTSDVCLLVAEVGTGACCRLPDESDWCLTTSGGADSYPSGGLGFVSG